MQFSRGIFNAFLRSAYIWCVKSCLHGHLTGRPCARLRMSKKWFRRIPPHGIMDYHSHYFLSLMVLTIPSLSVFCLFIQKKRNEGTEEEWQKNNHGRTQLQESWIISWRLFWACSKHLILTFLIHRWIIIFSWWHL